MMIQPGAMDFFAHSTARTDKADWQPLRGHLVSVGRLAAINASAFGGESLAAAAGLLHDLGKYTGEFQRRLEGQHPRLDHATAGARIARERYGRIGYLIAYGIAGHHAGLANGADVGERTPLQERLRAPQLNLLIERWREEIPLPAALSAPAPTVHSRERGNFQLSFLVRMLFSSLVDADFVDTEAFYDGIEGRESHRSKPSPTLDALRLTCVAVLRSDLRPPLRRQRRGFD